MLLFLITKVHVTFKQVQCMFSFTTIGLKATIVTKIEGEVFLKLYVLSQENCST